MKKIILVSLLAIPLITGCSTTYSNPLPDISKITENGSSVIQYTRQMSIPTSVVYRTTYPPTETEKPKDISTPTPPPTPKPWFTVAGLVEIVKDAFSFGLSTLSLGQEYYGSINTNIRYREDFLIILPKDSTNNISNLDAIMKELTKPIYDGQRSPWNNEK